MACLIYIYILWEINLYNNSVNCDVFSLMVFLKPKHLVKTLPETGSLPSVKWFAECCFSGTRQRRLCRVFFFYTRQRKFQNTFWSSKLIQMKKFSTTKLYNSSRCTMFVLVFSSYDKVKVNLFTNLTYLSGTLWNYKRDI